MPEITVFPPHLNQAKIALAKAGFDVEVDSPAFAALMFATFAWERTPQVNRAEELRAKLAKTQDQLAAANTALLVVRKENEQLAAFLKERPSLATIAAKRLGPTFSRPGNINISDHALLRFIERKSLLRKPTLNLNQLRAAIMPTCPILLADIRRLGDGAYRVGSSHRVVIRGKTVVTVLPPDNDGPLRLAS